MLPSPHAFGRSGSLCFALLSLFSPDVQVPKLCAAFRKQLGLHDFYALPVPTPIGRTVSFLALKNIWVATKQQNCILVQHQKMTVKNILRALEKQYENILRLRERANKIIL